MRAQHAVAGFVAGLKSAQDGTEVGQTEPERVEEGLHTNLSHLFWAVPRNGLYQRDTKCILSILLLLLEETLQVVVSSSESSLRYENI